MASLQPLAKSEHSWAATRSPELRKSTIPTARRVTRPSRQIRFNSLSGLPSQFSRQFLRYFCLTSAKISWPTRTFASVDIWNRMVTTRQPWDFPSSAWAAMSRFRRKAPISRRSDAIFSDWQAEAGLSFLKLVSRNSRPVLFGVIVDTYWE